jgi:hypothetical protein
MKNECIPHFLSSEEIANIMNDPIVTLNQNKLLERGMIHFSIPLSETIKTKLAKVMNVSQETIPMTWVRGDTVEHIDQGAPFETTFLIYLTDSVGQFIVDGRNYSITSGNAHIFSEGLSHSTIHTENDRLIMGPMSETGLPVGLAPSYTIYYYPTDKTTDSFIIYSYTNQEIQILYLPPPIPDSTNLFTIFNVNETGLSDAIIWANPSGKTFGGWKLKDKVNNIPIDTIDKIYMPGEIYTFTGNTELVPNWIDLPIRSRTVPFKLHFTNNSNVFYKSNSLSTGSGGSGVRNYRHKQRKT